MTRAEEMLRLAERCEAAAGPDREIDALIARAVGLSVGFTHGAPGWLVGGLGEDQPFQADLYTASLDAALTLVQETSIGGVVAWAKDMGAGAQVGFGGDPDTDEVKAATPALALCAAALRALAAMESQDA